MRAVPRTSCASGRLAGRFLHRRRRLYRLGRSGVDASRWETGSIAHRAGTFGSRGLHEPRGAGRPRRMDRCGCAAQQARRARDVVRRSALTREPWSVSTNETLGPDARRERSRCLRHLPRRHRRPEAGDHELSRERPSLHDVSHRARRPARMQHLPRQRWRRWQRRRWQRPARISTSQSMFLPR